MHPERWRQIDEIFQAALDSGPGNRSAFLDSACGADDQLRREVESLLAASEKSGFTAPRAFEDGLKVLEQRTQRLEEGRRLGPYSVLREIGRGGMGSVCLAARADDAYQKLVAIKIIRRELDSEDLVRRFRSERQILATLDHPNITRLLDGGTSDEGLPYFVMEYIEGEPIDQYCNARKLNISARLKLFQSVCAAVHYAHQNLVIHRDIKASNVLVTKEGVPRLLDFGIAKLLVQAAPADSATTLLRPLTPEYASPEQVRGGAITTASDVYSLGVLLYRLLTGRRPYGAAASTTVEIEEAICHAEPEKPSLVVTRRDGLGPGEAATAGPTPESLSAVREGTPEKLRRRLAGDLDNIVLMALRKEPQRRYTSVEQFSEDISRHLDNRPVIARPDTRGYRAAKFIRRHKAGVAAATLVFFVLSGGIAATLWQAHVARLERDRARIEKIKADHINSFMQELLGFSSGRYFTGNNPKGSKATLLDVLNDAAARVATEFSDQPEVRADMERTIGDFYADDATKLDLAERHLRAALEADLKVYGPAHQETARTLDSLGLVRMYRGDYAGGESFFRRALSIYRNLPKDANFDMEWYVATVSNLALLLRNEGRYAEADLLYREGLAWGSRLSGRAYIPVIIMRYLHGGMLAERGEFVEAESLARRAVQEFERMGFQQGELWAARLYLADILRDERKYAQADPLMRDTVAAFLAMGEGTSAGFALMNSAYLLVLEGRYPQAEQQARHALQIFQHSYPKGHPWTAGAMAILGLTLNKTGRATQAEALLRESLEIRTRLLGKKHYLTAFTQGLLGDSLAIQGRYAEAEPLLKDAYSTLTSVQKGDSHLVIEAAQRLQAFYTAWGKPQEAAQYHTTTLAERER
jgi:serine/threonine-protein kinase